MTLVQVVLAIEANVARLAIANISAFGLIDARGSVLTRIRRASFHFLFTPLPGETLATRAIVEFVRVGRARGAIRARIGIARVDQLAIVARVAIRTGARVHVEKWFGACAIVAARKRQALADLSFAQKARVAWQAATPVRSVPNFTIAKKAVQRAS